MKTREAWLDEATKDLTGWVVKCKAASLFPSPYVSIGFPKGGKGTKNTAIGQCWDKKASADQLCAHVFVSPTLSDAVEVLSTLLHELIHASVGTKCGHRGAFRRVALELGFMAPMTSTPYGDELKQRLMFLSQWLGPYPHSALKKQVRGSVGSRMVKMMCPDCGYIARTTAKWLNLNGAVQCPCNGHSMDVETSL